MSSPIPPDPYVALGVAKDADISAIRTAHRKLALKHHPDRIQDAALKERGKDEFQKIQLAYELLSDPVKRQRYDDKIRLAELRKEAMMRDPGPPRSYPMRPAPQSSPSNREYREEERTFYEERKPRDGRDPRDSRDSRDTRDSRDSYFDSKDKFEDPLRASSRKYPEYERRSSTSKIPERERPERSAKARWNTVNAAVNFGLKMKSQAEKTKSKAHETRQETRDRDKRKARLDKESRRAHVDSDDESDSDAATRVTSSTIRPSRPSPRHSRGPETPSNRSSGASRHRPYSGDDSDNETIAASKWENHHDNSIQYIQNASKDRRPNIHRDDSSFWGSSGRKSGSDSERRPGSSKGRYSFDEPPPRPAMPSHTSAPSNLKTRLEERSPNQRRSATQSYPTREREREVDDRNEIPPMHRAQTMPASRSASTKKDNAPSKPSGLKHGETHDSGYGSSSNPNTPDLREDSPPRRATQKSTRYAIVDPASDDDQRSRVKVLNDDSDHRRRRFHHSPEPERRDPQGRKEKSERPRVETQARTRSSREPPSAMPSMRRTESARYESRSPRDSPPISRHNSGRDKLFREMSSPDDREPSRYKYPSTEKVHVRPPYPDAKFSSYTDSSDRRGHDYSHNSRFHDNLRNPESRRPSVQG